MSILISSVVTFGQTLERRWVVAPFGDDSEDWDGDGAAHRWCIAMSQQQWCDSDIVTVVTPQLPSTTWRCHCWSPLLPLCQCHFLNWSLFLILLTLRPKDRSVHQSHLPGQWERGQNGIQAQQINESNLQGWSEGDSEIWKELFLTNSSLFNANCEDTEIKTRHHLSLRALWM